MDDSTDPKIDSVPSASTPAVDLHIVLVEPEIPPNTGNVIRLCANTGARLYLVGPLGFPIDSAKMRRAGLDYHEQCLFEAHESWASFLAAHQPCPDQCFGLTTKGHRSAFEAPLRAGTWLFFGAETRGLSPTQLAWLQPNHWLRLPMQANSRSLNLGNAVAVCVYEAWRQQGFGQS